MGFEVGHQTPLPFAALGTQFDIDIMHFVQVHDRSTGSWVLELAGVALKYAAQVQRGEMVQQILSRRKIQLTLGTGDRLLFARGRMDIEQVVLERFKVLRVMF